MTIRNGKNAFEAGEKSLQWGPHCNCKTLTPTANKKYPKDKMAIKEIVFDGRYLSIPMALKIDRRAISQQFHYELLGFKKFMAVPEKYWVHYA